MSTLIIQSDAERLPLRDDAVDLVFTSPPYLCARTYGIGAQRDCADWIDWMLRVVGECCRVSRGMVLVNCAGVTRDWCYRPGPEGLLYEWWKRGGRCWRPCYWQRVGIPGSGGKQWLRADVEYILAFTKCKARVPWADNVANGHIPKWGPGGEMSNRTSDGRRINQWGHSLDSGATVTDGDFVRSRGTRPSHAGPFGNQPSNVVRRANGDRKAPYFNGKQAALGDVVSTTRELKLRKSYRTGGRSISIGLNDGTQEQQQYIPPVKANPGNVVKINVGGGLMGHPLAHENEAPFPVDLAAWFIRSHCPPGGIVLDPFGGSGTTADAASREGRRAVTADLRWSQCELTARRLASPYAKRSKPKPPQTVPAAQFALFAEGGAQ